MGIGIPGSGKTTVLKEFARKNRYGYVCPDDIREEMTGDSTDQSKNREVWEEAYKRLQKKLADGENVVFDATFAFPGARKQLINFARQNGAEKIQGIYLDVGLETAKERNNLRERKVPDFILERMQDGLDRAPLGIEEGFDLIVTLDKEQELIDAEMKKENKVLHKEFGTIH
ncbi:MAG: hypothetical protein QG589_481 [Patescibacteria group bacterium]|nr:hypothetical protein [Patescibacteria group bacterium]